MILDMLCLTPKIMVFLKRENDYGYLDIWGNCQQILIWYHQKNLYKGSWQIFLTQIRLRNYIKHKNKLPEYTRFIIMRNLMLKSLFAMIFIIGRFVMTESV